MTLGLNFLLWKNINFWFQKNSIQICIFNCNNMFLRDCCMGKGACIKRMVAVDDDRRLVTSDVTAYVNKNQYRVVQLPFKVWISKGDYVKRVIGGKPVLSYTSHHLMSLNFRLFHWVCSISGVSTPLTRVNPVWGLNFQNRIGYYSILFTKHQIARDVTLL